MKICFLLDTSLSMNVLLPGGGRQTRFDACKSAIESYLMNDRLNNNTYILATYKPPYLQISSSGRDLLDALKLVSATDNYGADEGLAAVFEYLAVHRDKTLQISSGMGRRIGTETSAVFWMTDTENRKLNIPGSKMACMEMYIEPFRWDQKVIGIVVGSADYREDEIGHLSQYAGGTVARFIATKPLISYMNSTNCILSLTKALPAGFLVKMKTTVDQTTTFATIISPRSAPTFVIPEDYFLHDLNAFQWPTRTAHPTITVERINRVIVVLSGCPHDSVQVQGGTILKLLLDEPIGTCWYVYIEGSARRAGLGEPFGFLKRESESIFLYLMPYNFPRLQNIIQQTELGWNASLKKEFRLYLDDIPFYYHPILRKTMRPFAILIDPPLASTNLVKDVTRMQEKHTRECTAIFERLRPNFKVKENIPVRIANVFDIKKGDLSLQLALHQSSMRHKKSQEEEDLNHSVGTAEMSSFQTAMKKREMLRDVLEDDEDRKYRESGLFGNPYKKRPKSLSSLEDSIMPQNTVHRNLNRQRRVASNLYRKPKWRVAEYEGLTWKGLENYKYEILEHTPAVEPKSRKEVLIAKYQEGLERDRELELDVDKPLAVSNEDEVVEKIYENIIEELEVEKEPQNLDITSFWLSLSSSQLLLHIYNQLSRWPGEFDEQKVLKMLAEVFEVVQLELPKMEYILKMAERFKLHRAAAQITESISMKRRI